MSARKILIEEIRRQPGPVAREVLHYLKFLERQRAQEDWADVLTASRSWPALPNLPRTETKAPAVAEPVAGRKC